MVTLTTLTGSFTIFVKTIPDGSVIDGPPAYSVDTPGVVAIQPAADGLSAKVTAVANGTATISVSAMANGQKISGNAVVQVTVAIPPPPPVFATALDVTVSPVVP